MDDFDLFDAVDHINGENRQNQQQQNVESNDSAISDSISGFGADADNPDANEQYILDNQQPIIQGHFEVQHGNVQNGRVESGLASSISRSHESEFEPIIEEYPENDQTKTSNLKSEATEGELDHTDAKFQNDNATNADVSNKYDIEKFKSSFDLAIEKGYTKQAMVYLQNRDLSKDFRSMHLKPLSELVEDGQEEDLDRNDRFINKKCLIELFNMELLCFQNYLELIEVDKFDEVLRIMKERKKHNLMEILSNNPSKPANTEIQKILGVLYKDVKKCKRNRNRNRTLKQSMLDRIKVHIKSINSFKEQLSTIV